ncbi:MAG: TetR/AcrR family transcriptional regulator [Nocardioidaceae bacterium]|nr:TetR/AcrR family transcriptional regulator [Nocardioidaceae bacterium]MBA3990394.1 TetR/AcrR family transcriptional regulator [Propionibacteriales bacterium]
MPQRKPRLTRGDWVLAGLAALGRDGLGAVAIEPVARSLGLTKGSGYWHFSSRADLVDAVLAAWLDVATDRVVSAVQATGGSPRERLGRLLETVLSEEVRYPGFLMLQTAPTARSVVETSTHRRIGYVRQLLVEAGVPRSEAGRRALLVYTSYLGYAVLAQAAPGSLPRGVRQRRELQTTMLAAALGES